MKKLMLTAAAAMMFVAPAMANEKDGMNHERMTEHFFMKMDVNGDKMISEDEHEDFADRMFDEADKDNNGSLSMSEVTAHKKAEKQKYKSETGQTEAR